jgi:DNA-binding transcriptional LysR family regulator
MLPLDKRIFTYEKLAEEELILAVPASYKPFQTQSMTGLKYPAINVKDINEHSFVMLTDSQFMQKQLQNLIIDYKLTLRTASVVKSLGSQIAMVRAGVGMALVPSGIERFCSTGEVSFYSFAECLPKRVTVVMWRKGRQLSTIENELKTLIKNTVLYL